MPRASSGAWLLALWLSVPAWADELSVTIEAPVAGTEVNQLTFPVRVRVTGEAASVEVMWPRKRGGGLKRVAALESLGAGLWGGEVRPREGLRIVARDAAGHEAQAELPAIVDRTGWVQGQPEIMAPGASLEQDVKLTDLAGVELDLNEATPTLVVFYSIWNDCEAELEWIKQVRRRFAGKALRVIGVGSVAASDVETWRAWLAEREVDWHNVADTGNDLGKPFHISPRKVVGNVAAGAVVYLFVSRAMHGGDYADRDHFRDPSRQLMTMMALESTLR